MIRMLQSVRVSNTFQTRFAHGKNASKLLNTFQTCFTDGENVSK